MKFKSAHIGTSNKEIIEGIEYAYREGSFKAKVKVLENNSEEELISFKLYVIESNREDSPPGDIFSVSAADHKIAYSGMWRLWDLKCFYDKRY
jgi:hypothetical protein